MNVHDMRVGRVELERRTRPLDAPRHHLPWLLRADTRHVSIAQRAEMALLALRHARLWG